MYIIEIYQNTYVETVMTDTSDVTKAKRFTTEAKAKGFARSYVGIPFRLRTVES